jgi:plastocyanin
MAITWTASVNGGSGTKTYRFQLLKDGKEIVAGKYGSSKTYKYTPAAPGKYKVKVYVKDSTGTVSKSSAEVTAKAPAMTASVKPSKTSVKTGEAITWTASFKGGSGKKTYRFQVFKDGKEIVSGKYSSSQTYKYTPAAPGKYKVKLYIKDSWSTVSANSAETIVKAPPLVISSIKANKTSVKAGAAITWTATATGGSGKKTYRFVLYKDDKELASGKYGSSKTYKYTPTAPGKYKVKVYIKDSSGTVSKVSTNVSVR